jgi:iron complex outermembrane receptor protein
MGGWRRKGKGLALLAFAGTALAQPAKAPDLADLSLEELANVQVTSVFGRAERLSDAPASIYVISADDIRRSGATSLPEALRLAPNLQVARIDASQYAISARGFNNSIANKLLVLIDGRTVYTPFYSGVFWDQTDVMLDDVERIEVISGPGGTLWGANAVNGVINVITRPAGDTQGGLLAMGAGNLEGAAAYRYGGKLGDNGHFRVYAKGSQLQNTKQANGTAAADGRDWGQGGFRADWSEARDSFTLQGDGYQGRAEDRGSVAVFPPFTPALPAGRIETSGLNLLGRWTRSHDDGSQTRVQMYFDRTEHDDRLLYRPRSDIFDIEFQHGTPVGQHRVLLGGGYRRSDDYIAPAILFTFVPESRRLDWANLFVQGEVKVGDAVGLTLGVKAESNDYSGIEYLPSARLGWKLFDRDLAWLALSRAVRAPARLDHDIRWFVNIPGLPPLPFIVGGDTFDSEIANVLELGYRGQPARALTWSATAFVHEWDRLRSGQVPPARVQNRMEGNTYGLEAWGAWQATAAWRLSAGGTLLRKELRLEPGAVDPDGTRAAGNDPEFTWQLRSSLNVASDQDFDVIVRRVARLPNPLVVPEYTALDLRYAWRVKRGLELSLTVQNAADPSHPEFGTTQQRSEIGRSVFAAVKWAH